MFDKIKSFFKALGTAIAGFVKSKTAKRFYWQMTNAGVAAFIVYLTDINWAYLAVIQPILNGITKEINNNYQRAIAEDTTSNSN